MLTLDELLVASARLPSVDAFVRAYPHPALSLRIPSENEAEQQARLGKTVRLNDTVDDEGLAGLLGDPMDRSHVAFLEKSSRNPFGNIISVGRAATNDLVIPHASISKVHAVFTNVGAAWKITERKARNGLYVNRVLLDPGATATVEDGALVGLGTQVEGTFHLPRGLWQFLQLSRGRVRKR